MKIRYTLIPLALSLGVACSQQDEPPSAQVPPPAPATLEKEVALLRDEAQLGVAQPRSADAAPVVETRAEVLRESRQAVAQKQRAKPTEALAQPSTAMPSAPVRIRPGTVEESRENYASLRDNGITRVRDNPVSTLSVDVDTGSYAIVRRYLNQGQLPPRDAVRAEELINYFSYDYPRPTAREEPLRLYTEVAPTPWNPDSLLLHVGLQGYLPAARPAANLVFLIDVSGSMNAPDKLPLLVNSFKLLSARLGPEDRVSLVTYAGNAGVVLEPTPGDRKEEILAALERLGAGGSTHGSAGIQSAYRLAREARIAGGINRVILATDGDFNVGTVNHDQLIELIEEQRDGGISLTTLGFGRGNYNDRLMEQLADHGNGNYGYIDSLQEAQKLLVDELASTLETIAGDVKLQLEFNPALVAEYRLVGYENRLLAREDFNDDRVDAGEVGAGHRVTALYEITLVGAGRPSVDPLRYAQVTAGEKNAPANIDELAFIKLRYKLPGQGRSTLLSRPVARDVIGGEPSERFRFAASVAGFAQLLRGGRHLEGFDHRAVIELANGARGDDPFGYRGEFVRLARLAESLSGS